MIYGERGLAFTTIHALEAVATEDVLARELDLFEGHPQVGAEADHAGVGIGLAHRTHGDGRPMFYHFGFCEEEQEEGFLGAADADRLIGLVEDQDLRIERRRGIRRLAEGFGVYVDRVYAEGSTSLTLK